MWLSRRNEGVAPLAFVLVLQQRYPTTASELHDLAANPSHEASEAFKGLFQSLKPHWQDLGVRFTDFNKVTLLCR